MSCLDLTGVCFGPEYLYDAVVARFAEDGTDVRNFFSWHEKVRQKVTDCRIIWYPGDDESASIGALSAPVRPGNNPRSLGTLDEVVTVYIDAYDPSDATNDRAQYRQARGLFNAWWRAVRGAAGANVVSVLNARWVNPGAEMRRGATLRVLLEVRGPIPDEAYQTVTDAGAEIDVSIGTHTETLSIP